MIIGTVVVFAIALIAYYDEKTINPFFYVGTFFLFGTIISLLTGFFHKRLNFKKFKEIADEFELKQMDCVFEFFEEKVLYSDKEKRFELKWDVFTNYTTYKDYFILIIKDSYWQSYYYKDTEPDQEFERIKSFIKSKLEFKKIK
jgi:hypothetical protein